MPSQPKQPAWLKQKGYLSNVPTDQLVANHDREDPGGSPAGDRDVRALVFADDEDGLVEEDVLLAALTLDAEVAANTRGLLALNPRRLVTSHGGRDECVREAAEIAPAYDVLLEAHGVPPD